jgi:maltose alpha-D-glucosyltransferase/alpha-amylase
MQWTPDRNAGFSTADPGKLYLPLIQSLVHHYNHTNVEAQLAQPTSLLHWVHGMLAVRRLHPTFGTGDFTARRCDDHAVLAFTRASSEETILVAANLSTTARSATISLPGFEGWTITDMFGGGRFPAVSADGTVTMTWGSREFYWLMLTPPSGTQSGGDQ